MYDGENLIDIIIQFHPDLTPDLIDILRSTTNIDSIKGSVSYGKIIHEGLNNPLYKEQILSLPEQCFRMIRTTKEDAQIIQDHFHPKAQTESFDDYKEFQDLMGSNNNWYIKYSMTQEMLKEAGWKENLTMTLLSAILTVLGGSNVEVASKKHNIKENDLRMALQNKEMVMKAKEIQKKMKTQPQSSSINTPSLDDIYNFIKANEGSSGKIYKDPAGNLAIGIGFNIDRPFAKKWFQQLGIDYNAARNGSKILTDDEIKKLFQRDAELALLNAKKFVSNFDSLPYDVKLVLIDMSFNLGENRLSKFIKLKNALEKNDFQEAAKEMKNSKWYNQVKNRGEKLVAMVQNSPTYIAQDSTKQFPPTT
jgi:lysozyme